MKVYQAEGIEVFTDAFKTLYKVLQSDLGIVLAVGGSVYNLIKSSWSGQSELTISNSEKLQKELTNLQVKLGEMGESIKDECLFDRYLGQRDKVKAIEQAYLRYLELKD